MLSRLLLLFIVVPLVELALLLVIGDLTHWWVSWLLVILSGIVGALLVRWQGIQTIRRMRTELIEGRSPADSLWDAAMIFFAGALMLTPGVFTDIFGISLLVPRCRVFYKRLLVARLKQRFGLQPFDSGQSDAPSRSKVIDTYVVESDGSDEQCDADE